MSKKFIVGCVVCCLLGGSGIPSASARVQPPGMPGAIDSSVHEEVVEKRSSVEGTVLKDEFITSTGNVYAVTLNQQTEEVTTWINGKALETRSLGTVVSQTQQLIAESPATRRVRRDACTTTLTGVRYANQVLWYGARGMAVVPQARLIAAGGGLVTGLILRVGAHYC